MCTSKEKPHTTHTDRNKSKNQNVSGYIFLDDNEQKKSNEILKAMLMIDRVELNERGILLSSSSIYIYMDVNWLFDVYMLSSDDIIF